MEVLHVNLIESGPLSNILHHDRAFEDLIQRGSIFFKDTFDIGKDLMCFLYYATFNKPEFSRLGAQLT